MLFMDAEKFKFSDDNRNYLSYLLVTTGAVEWAVLKGIGNFQCNGLFRLFYADSYRNGRYILYLVSKFKQEKVAQNDRKFKKNV